ncbi:unnamed protein product [Larinioides sclopetarius]
MLEDEAVEDSDDFSMEDPVCMDGVIFYGPMTDREKMVKERFERRQNEKVKTQFLSTLSNKEFPGSAATKVSEGSKNDINDISIYESFSIDESKYESFNDSLDERKFLNPNEVNISKFSPEQINVNKRKLQSKSMLKGSLCDSLEDIHSLVSNVEKLSISEEIENINILEKNLYDDSLRNDVCLENKNLNPTDQNFDDDSLAILDFEKAFDDSLEEGDILSLSHMDNVIILRNGENAEISVENLAKENAITKNLFETSVEVIYENAGYVENSEEGNAEPTKQLSLTADSLSLSENMSKDSLGGLPVIPKYLEQNVYKRSLSSLTRDEYDISRSSPKLECYGNVVNMSDSDLKLVSEQNLPHNVNVSSNKQFTYIKRNASNSNDTIIIENSFKSPDAMTTIKREDSVKSIVKDFSSQINNSFCKNRCATLSSYSASNINSMVNDHANTSNEITDKTDIHPNDTICIDDSVILYQNTSLIKDELHLVDAQAAGNQKVNQKNISTDNINDVIYVNYSMQHTPNIKSEKSTPKKSINSKFHVQNPIKHKLEILETENHLDNTICIDDSFNLPSSISSKKNELYSLKTRRSGSSKNSAQNLFSENNDTCSPKLNDTLNNSFTVSSQPMLDVKNVKTPSSLKRKKDKSSQGKDSRSYIQSPTEHQLRHLEKNNEVRVSHMNETICIIDSPVEPLKVKVEKKSSSSGIGFKMTDKCSTQNNSIDSKFHIHSPIKYKSHHLEKKNEAKVSNLNGTIYIDSSPSESLRIKMDKSSFSGEGSKAQSPECKNDDVSSQKQFTSLQTSKILDSPLEETSKCSSSDNIVKDPKKVIDYFKDTLVLPKDLPKDSNVKLQLEVVFDENQGINIISVSTIDRCTGNITPSITKVDSRREIVEKANQSPDVNHKNKGTAMMKINGNICENSVASDKIISKSRSPELCEVKSSFTRSYLEKNKTDSIFIHDVQNDSNGHNVQLLEALDLHDASCSFIDNGFLQSRDSIMPLNLCIRNRSPETSYQYFTKTESKENIPLSDKQPVTSEDHSRNRRRSSSKASNKTPKQPTWNTDAKKSGNKTNSITKIPVRKVDNLFTPVHQKVTKDMKTGSSSEKIFKNPLVKSNSATDNLASAKPLETPRKHHFCSVRNSISRVPKSTPRSIPKRFQNIESPIAKYIGKPQIYTPLKATHRFEGNLILGNTVKSSKLTIKTPNSACKGSPQCSSAEKL